GLARHYSRSHSADNLVHHLCRRTDRCLGAKKEEATVTAKSGSFSTVKIIQPSLLVRLRQIQNNLPLETHKFVQRLLKDSLLIAVRAKTLRNILDVSHRANAITLNATRANLSHVGPSRHHGGQRHGIVDPPVSRLDEMKSFGVQTRRWSTGSNGVRNFYDFDRGIVDDLAKLFKKSREIFIRQRANVERGFCLGRNDIT